VLLVSAGLAGCREDDLGYLPGTLPMSCDDPVRRTLRIDQVRVPNDAISAEETTVDLDGDRTPDNQGGNIYAAIVTIDQTLLESDPPRIDAHIRGDVDWRIDIERCDVEARVTLSNAGEVTSIREAEAGGFIQGDHLSVELGTGEFPLGMFFDPIDSQEVAWQGAYPVAMELDLDSTGASGRVAVGLTPGYDNTMIDAFWPYLEASTATGDPTWLDIFDDDQDGVLTRTEFTQSSLVETLLRPDLDVGANVLEPPARPRLDGTRESLSFGVGIHAVDVE
jgi:hypothetical protein